MWGVGNPETFLEHPFDSRGESLAEGRLALSLFEIGCPFRVERLGMTFNFLTCRMIGVSEALTSLGPFPSAGVKVH